MPSVIIYIVVTPYFNNFKQSLAKLIRYRRVFVKIEHFKYFVFNRVRFNSFSFVIFTQNVNNQHVYDISNLY